MAPYVEIIHPLIDTSGEFPADFGPLLAASQRWSAPARADRYSPADDWSANRNLIALDAPRPARPDVFWQAGDTIVGVIDTEPAWNAPAQPSIWADQPALALSGGQRSWAVWLGD